MAVCANRECDNPVIITSNRGMKKIYCCDPCRVKEDSLKQRDRIRAKRALIKYPVVECALDECSVKFEKKIKSKIYCCYEHKKIAEWKRADKKRLKQKHKTKEQKEKARIFATLNCLNFPSCSDEIKINAHFKFSCHNCKNKVIKLNAFHQELEPVAHNTDEYPIYLPKIGT